MIKFLMLFFLAFFLEFVDSILGMGYGTSLTPILILIGFPASKIVPSVLFSEFLTGILAGIIHHKFGNVRFDFRRDEKIVLKRLSGLSYVPRSEDAKVSYFLIIFGMIGALISSSLSISVLKKLVSVYIAFMVTGIGIYILIHSKKEAIFRWKTFLFIAFLAGFNKGISGGGYGPLVAGGQIVTGRSAKSAIGTTSLAEGIVCFISILIYLFLGNGIDLKTALPLLIGASLSTPFSGIFVKKTPEKNLKLAIGIVVLILGILNILKVFNLI